MMDDFCEGFGFFARLFLVVAIACLVMSGLVYLLEVWALSAGWIGEGFPFHEVPLLGAVVFFALAVQAALAVMVAAIAIILGEFLGKILSEIQWRFF